MRKATYKEIEIQEPVKDIPNRNRKRKYEEVFNIANELRKGYWLPVTLKSAVKARSFLNSAKHSGFSVKRRKLVVYIQKNGNLK